MIRGDNNSWLVPLADLSLILFIVTGATLAGTLGKAPAEEEEARSMGGIAQGVPASVHIDFEDGPSLSEWLLQYSPGPGEQLTIQAMHTPQDRAAVIQRAEQLAQQAISAGQQPRVIIQPASETRITSIFAHDRDPQMAQSLLPEGQY